jgi:hypothetical protein
MEAAVDARQRQPLPRILTHCQGQVNKRSEPPLPAQKARNAKEKPGTHVRAPGIVVFKLAVESWRCVVLGDDLPRVVSQRLCLG